MISFKRQVASRFCNMTPPPVPPTSTHSFYCLQFFKEFSIAAMIKSYLNCLHIQFLFSGNDFPETIVNIFALFSGYTSNFLDCLLLLMTGQLGKKKMVYWSAIATTTTKKQLFLLSAFRYSPHTPSFSIIPVKQ